MKYLDFHRELRSSQSRTNARKKIDLIRAQLRVGFVPDQHQLLVGWALDELSSTRQQPADRDVLWKFLFEYLQEHEIAADEIDALRVKNCLPLIRQYYADTAHQSSLFDLFRLLDQRYPQLVQPKFDPYFEFLIELKTAGGADSPLQQYLTERLLADMLPAYTQTGKRLFELVAASWDSGIARHLDSSDEECPFRRLIDAMLFHHDNLAGYSQILGQLAEKPDSVQGLLLQSSEQSRTAISYQRVLFQKLHASESVCGCSAVFEMYLQVTNRQLGASTTAQLIHKCKREQFALFRFIVEKLLQAKDASSTDAQLAFDSLERMLALAAESNVLSTVNDESLAAQKAFFIHLLNIVIRQTHGCVNRMALIIQMIRICPQLALDSPSLFKELLVSTPTNCGSILTELATAYFQCGRFVEFVLDFMVPALSLDAEIKLDAEFLDVCVV